MEFDNHFTVSAPPDTVYRFMLNAREVAPCVPGAQITEEIDEHHFKGTAKVKVGPVQMTYRGELEMQPDAAERTIVLRARGTEARGGGGASGTVTTQIKGSPSGGTDVEIHSQIDVSGRAAQFGRGLMQDVATKLIKEFAQCLEAKLEAQQAELGTSASLSKEPAGEETVAPDSAADLTAAGAEVPPPIIAPDAAARIEPAPSPLGAPTLATPPGTTVLPATPGATSSVSEPGMPASSSSNTSPSTGGAALAPSPSSPSISVTSLLISVLRSRAAAGLRALADRLEE